MFCDSPSSDLSAESRTRFGTDAWFSFGCSHARFSCGGLPPPLDAASAARKGLLCAVSLPTCCRRAPCCRVGLSFSAGERGTGDAGECMSGDATGARRFKGPASGWAATRGTLFCERGAVPDAWRAAPCRFAVYLYIMPIRLPSLLQAGRIASLLQTAAASRGWGGAHEPLRAYG